MKKTYIIAEIGNTHEGSLGLAKQFVKAAAECGVDCVKLQTHIFEAESLPDAPNPPYFKDETRKEYFERTALNISEYKKIKEYCEELGVDFMSSPFSEEAVDFLEEVNVDMYKIASGEVTNLPLLKKIAKTGKKVFLSSGMSNWKELDMAVDTLKESGAKDIVLFQCVSEYPCKPENSGLNLIEEYKARYNLTVGYSDHTLGVAIPLAAVVMGAEVIEKHFTLSKKMYGSDAMNSTEPDEFKFLVDQIRQVEIAISSKVDKDSSVAKFDDMKFIFQKTIVAKRALEAGHVIAEEDLAYKKPLKGISAAEYNSLVGRKIKRSYIQNEVIDKEELQ